MNGFTKALGIILAVMASLLASGRIIGSLVQEVSNNKTLIQENRDSIKELNKLVYENSKQIAVLSQLQKEFEKNQKLILRVLEKINDKMQ